MKIICVCGHGIDQHNNRDGCQKVERVNNYDSFCPCRKFPQVVAEEYSNASVLALMSEIEMRHGVDEDRWGELKKILWGDEALRQ
jgi:hypothetical protein